MADDGQTRVWNVTPDAVQAEALTEAARILEHGGLVAFPTETVYGLGADALNPDAVRRVFAAKGRPPDNPLIVHVADEAMARRLVPCDEEWAIVQRLAAAFWPGPLTVVVSRSPQISRVVTAGLDTVALRMPDHPVALALIRQLGRPVAAPSANRSGRPSPTLPQHVLEDLSGRIDGVIHAGPCRVGVESTVLDVTRQPPVLLRPGGVTPAQLSAVLQTDVAIHGAVYALDIDGGAVAMGPVPSPGMKYTHYAPRTPLLLLEGDLATVPSLLAKAKAERTKGKRVALVVTAETAPYVVEFPHYVLGSRHRPQDIAANLFASLRAMDDGDYDVMIVEGIEPVGVGLAVMNRLRRAAAPEQVDLAPPLA